MSMIITHKKIVPMTEQRRHGEIEQEIKPFSRTVKSYVTLCKLTFLAFSFFTCKMKAITMPHVAVLWQFIHSLCKDFLSTYSVCQDCSMDRETAVNKTDKNLCPVVLKFW